VQFAVNVDGSIVTAGAVDIGGAAAIGGNADVAGDASVVGNATVTGNATVSGDLTVDGAQATLPTVAIGGAATVSGDLTVNGAQANLPDVSITGAATVSGDLTVNGTQTSLTNVTVNGDETATGSLTRTGNEDIAGNLVVSTTDYVAGSFSANLDDESTRAVLAEVTSTGLNDAVAIEGISIPSDYYGVGGLFRGGYKGVEGNVVPTGAEEYHGVIGYVGGGSGTNYGVSGYAFGDGSNRGIYGYASGVGTNYAGYFAGDTHVTGTLTKGAGSFKIDHPLDPANQYLYHAFVESPDMKNMYDGVVELDGVGRAWIDLPEWFEALNTDFRYQLTPIGAPMPDLHVATEISGNRFKIAGGIAGYKVSWCVTGIRIDPYAEANRVPVEVPKPPSEVGTYLHPAAYGMPEEMGVDYDVPKTAKAQVEGTP
jgi:hypothetical protein